MDFSVFFMDFYPCSRHFNTPIFCSFSMVFGWKLGKLRVKWGITVMKVACFWLGLNVKGACRRKNWINVKSKVLMLDWSLALDSLTSRIWEFGTCLLRWLSVLVLLKLSASFFLLFFLRKYSEFFSFHGNASGLLFLFYWNAPCFFARPTETLFIVAWTLYGVA